MCLLSRGFWLGLQGDKASRPCMPYSLLTSRRKGLKHLRSRKLGLLAALKNVGRFLSHLGLCFLISAVNEPSFGNVQETSGSKKQPTPSPR